jgi:hypothetical protein
LTAKETLEFTASQARKFLRKAANVGIYGIAGAEVSAQGGIKFVLRKKV